MSIAGVFLIIYLHTAVAQDLPRVTQIIWPEVKRVGMTGYLNCTVNRQLDNKVQWIHNRAQDLILTSDDRVEVDERINEVVDGYQKYDVQRRQRDDQTTYMLIVRRLVLTDAGNYTCQVVVKGSFEHPSKVGQMIVLIPPAIVQGMTTQTVTIDEGSNVNLTCAATGYPTPNISWVRVNGNPLPPPFNRFMYMGGKIQLMKIRGIDRGMYRCVADNNVRPLATYDATVYVNFAPVARPIQSSYGQAQNRLFDLTIDCIVAGYPPPEMKWLKEVGNGLVEVIDDDKHIINQMLSHGQQLSISEVWYQLTIINVQANDYGFYVCQGTNKLGYSQYRIQVYETSECQGANCPPEGGTFAGVGQTSPFTSAIFLLLLSAFLFTRF